MQAEPVTLATLPAELVSAWKSKDGIIRVEALPKGDPNDNDTLRKFARRGARCRADRDRRAGLDPEIRRHRGEGVHPCRHLGAAGDRPVAVDHAAAVRRRADDAGAAAGRRRGDAGDLRADRLPLNFANIVAFPLLLGVGVAFKIYYVVAWRSGRTNLLQTSLTRAMFFSALTTATAFGSLWLSSHPGTSSMGKLLALSLVTTLAAVLLFQPVLMGKPRNLRE